MNESNNNNIDQRFQSRLQSGVETIKTWYNLPKSFLAEVRNSIPLDELMSTSTTSKYYRKDDAEWNNDKDDLLLKRLTLYFQKDVMTWMNQPTCSNCGWDKTVNVGTRGPETTDEIFGGASRVEVYNCPQCNTNTTFPRYNNPQSIYKRRKGRCGEYANLFGVYCLSLGYDQIRYILDSTDHVWIEIYSLSSKKYIMADSCEGLIYKNSMYEKGWGKKLNYIIGYSNVSSSDNDNISNTIQVIDVTNRYTRKYNTTEFQNRRRQICSSEHTSELIIERFNNSSYKRYVNDNGTNYLIKRCKEIYNREINEKKYLNDCKNKSNWDDDDDNNDITGRISGDLLWRASRNELGNNTSTTTIDSSSITTSNKTKNDNNPTTLFILPNKTKKISISITPNIIQKQSCILVSNKIPCAIGAIGYNIVVIDERNGCILQSVVYITINDVNIFLDTIPIGRIITMVLLKGENEQFDDVEDLKLILSKYFGGISAKQNNNNDKLYGFIGQIGYTPKWSTLLTLNGNYLNSTNKNNNMLSYPQKTIHIQLQNNDTEQRSKLKLYTTNNYLPSTISCRMPIVNTTTSSMSLLEKKDLFMKNYKEDDNYIGFITKENAHMYLFTCNDVYPWIAVNNNDVDDSNCWTTNYLLPEELVSKDDNKQIQQKEQEETATIINVPINYDYFKSLLQTAQLSKNTATNLPIENALSIKTRLIGLYFSAHWCPPCKRYTPMLIEFYNSINLIPEYEGIFEIIFISSDRDITSFQQYYDTMPWLSTPQLNQLTTQLISQQYQIRGIPNLVILDSISGNIVSKNGREDVMRICQRGYKFEELIDNWLQDIPDESQMIMETLKISIDETMHEQNDDDNEEEDDEYKQQLQSFLYIQQINSNAKTTAITDSISTVEDRVKIIFTKLVNENGIHPSKAAIDAIQQVAKEDNSNNADNNDKTSMIFDKDTTLSKYPSLYYSITSFPSCVCVSNDTNSKVETAKKEEKENKIKDDCASIAFNTINDNVNNKLLQGLRICKDEKNNTIIGFECLYDNNNDDELSTMYKYIKKKNDDTITATTSSLTTTTTNNDIIIRIDGIWNEEYHVVQELKFISKNSNCATTNNAKSFENDCNFSLDVPTNEDVIGVHGTFTRNGISSIGITCIEHGNNDSIIPIHINDTTTPTTPTPNNISKDVFKQALKINKSDVITILSTVIKYVTNCINNPHCAKYRHFKISNKIVDKNIVCYEHSIDLIISIGLDVMMPKDGEDDIVIKIPLGCNLIEMKRIVDCLLDYFK